MWLCVWEVNASVFLLPIIMCSLSFSNKSYICMLEKKSLSYTGIIRSKINVLHCFYLCYFVISTFNVQKHAHILSTHKKNY